MTDGKSAPKELPPVSPPRAEAAFVPEGYRVEVVVTDLTYPSSVDFDDRGNLYVAEAGHVYGDESAPARILRVSADGALSTFAERFNGPITDVLWHEGRLYVSHRGTISSVDRDGTVRDLVSDLPSYGDHYNNQLTIGPDGKLYFGQGTVTNSGVVGIDNFLFLWLPKYPDLHDRPARAVRLAGETFLTINPLMLGSPDEPKLVRTAAFQPFGRGLPEDNVVHGTVKANGTILRMGLDGRDLEVYAWGLRNPFGVLWTPEGKLFVSDNGYDERGSRPIANAPDCVWQVKQGAWYGFPDYAAGMPVTDARFHPKEGPVPSFLLADHPPVEKPFLTRPPHVAVTKMDVSPGAEFGFSGELFLAEFGDMTPITGRGQEPVGHRVVRIDPRRGTVSDFFRARPEALGSGDLAHVTTAGPRRPIDVRFSKDGALYVVDVGAYAALSTTVPLPQPIVGTGVVWRIAKAGTRRLSPPAGVSAKPGQKGP